MSQIFLFTGENAYALLEEKRRWIQEFCKKHGEENFVQLIGKQCKFQETLEQCSAAPFIAEKRLVAFDGMPHIDKEEFDLLVDALHPQILVLIIEPKPDKRLVLSKAILNTAEVRTFTQCSGNALVSWVQEFVQKSGAQISTDTARHLIHTVGEDQMLLATELRKLATFAHGLEITQEMIASLAVLSQERTSWLLMDLLFAQKCQEALVFARNMLASGENPYALWNRLLWIVAQIALVASACAEGNVSPASIAKTTGVPFPTAKTLLPVARTLDAKKLQHIVHMFSFADREFKTGGYRATVEAPEEMLTVIDRSIVKLATL